MPGFPSAAWLAGGCGLPQELRARQENLRRGRSSLAQQIERLTEAYLSGVLKLGEYQCRRQELERRDATLASQEELLSFEASRAMEVSGSDRLGGSVREAGACGSRRGDVRAEAASGRVAHRPGGGDRGHRRVPLRVPDRSGRRVRPVLSFAGRLSSALHTWFGRSTAAFLSRCGYTLWSRPGTGARGRRYKVSGPITRVSRCTRLRFTGASGVPNTMANLHEPKNGLRVCSRSIRAISSSSSGSARAGP